MQIIYHGQEGILALFTFGIIAFLGFIGALYLVMAFKAYRKKQRGYFYYGLVLGIPSVFFVIYNVIGYYLE